MRSRIGYSLPLLGLFVACRSRPDGASSQTTSSHEAQGSARALSNGAAPPSAAVAWTPLGKGVSWARRERKDVEGRNTMWSIVRVALDDADLDIVEPPRARLEQLPNDPTMLVAINGGFFEADGGPSGLLVSNGRRLGAFDVRGGSGVFIVSERHARLVAADAGVATMQGQLVLQCGPRLIEPDGTIGIRSDDGKRASRTAVCIREGGREVSLVLAWTRNSDRDGPGLLEMAEWLREPLAPGDASGCEAALNLDGGPSTGIVLRDRPDESHKPFGRVPFALVVREGAGTPSSADR